MRHKSPVIEGSRAKRRPNLLLWGGMFLGGVIALAMFASKPDGDDDEVVQPVTLVDDDPGQASANSQAALEDPQDPDTAPNELALVPERLAVRVIKRHPHDRGAFTQGLLWHEGAVYESTGQYGESTLRVVELKTGSVLDQETLARNYFGEGLARVDDHLVQLTWRSGVALYWQLSDLEQLKTVRYEGEGWGLCFNGTDLVMSDGSSMLTFRDPNTFDVRRELRVTQQGRSVVFLNELECVGDNVYANVWRTEDILRIDPTTGKVTAIIDASGLLDAEDRLGTDVLNGIAYVPETKRFLLTGKRWPYVFEVEFEPSP